MIVLSMLLAFMGGFLVACQNEAIKYLGALLCYASGIAVML